MSSLMQMMGSGQKSSPVANGNLFSPPTGMFPTTGGPSGPTGMFPTTGGGGAIGMPALPQATNKASSGAGAPPGAPVTPGGGGGIGQKIGQMMPMMASAFAGGG